MSTIFQLDFQNMNIEGLIDFLKIDLPHFHQKFQVNLRKRNFLYNESDKKKLDETFAKSILI